MTTTMKAPSLVVRPRDWMRELGVGKHGLAILIRDHGHPKPFPLGKRSSGFDRAECEAWVESRKAQRDTATPENSAVFSELSRANFRVEGRK